MLGMDIRAHIYNPSIWRLREVNCFEFKTNLDGSSFKIKPNQKVASTDGPETLRTPWFPGARTTEIHARSQHGREGHCHVLLPKGKCLPPHVVARRRYPQGMPALGATHQGLRGSLHEENRAEKEYSCTTPEHGDIRGRPCHFSYLTVLRRAVSKVPAPC